MLKEEIIKILDTPDEELSLDLLTDEEVEKIILRKREIMNCSGVGYTYFGSGACCCAQVDSACIDGNGPDNTCLAPLPTC